jgi:hypothetical protein
LLSYKISKQNNSVAAEAAGIGRPAEYQQGRSIIRVLLDWPLTSAVLLARIKQQVEHYFSPSNLAKVGP